MSKQEFTDLPIVAAFDFDGTITYYDSLIPFIFFVFGFWRALLGLMMLLPYFIGFIFGMQTRTDIKEHIVTHFFKNMPLAELQNMGKLYAETTLNKKIRPSAIDRIKWHKEQNHRLVLVSASLDIYLKPWAEYIGFQDYLTSSLLVDDQQRVTGKLNGFNCRGPEKINRLQELLGERKKYILYAYGDSDGDKEMLESADFPFYRKMSDNDR